MSILVILEIAKYFQRSQSMCVCCCFYISQKCIQCNDPSIPCDCQLENMKKISSKNKHKDQNNMYGEQSVLNLLEQCTLTQRMCRQNGE